LKIATLTDAAAHLQIVAHVGYGLGYSPTESRQNREKEIGLIAIDSTYTPVKRVGYEIENVRVGEMTNWDKLTLNIETDGSINCQTAFRTAVSILAEQFNGLLGKSEISESEKKIDESEMSEKKKEKKEKKSKKEKVKE
jgi:DNA-directed RNA polymerase subunit alpha